MKFKLLGWVVMTMFIVNVTAQYSNATEKSDNPKDVDEIIETILASGRQGRNIDGLDDVYQDPSIQNALNSGDDAEARNLIKEKLCSLGLMQCDNVEGKRPSYYSPDDLIYAQPIAIKPVGRPIPSVPFRGPPPPLNPNYSKYPPPPTHNGPYGPPKPMPVPGNFNGQPPRKVGYGGPPLSKPFLNSPPPSFTGPGPIYLSKPPGPIYEGPDSPYEYERPGKISSSSAFSQSSSFASQQELFHEKPTIVVNAQGGAATNGQGSGLSGLRGEPIQQHVHHHYHHAEADIKVPVVVNNPIVPVPVPVGHNSIQSNEFSSSGYQSSNQLSTNGFTPMTSGFSGYYGKQQNDGLSSSISSGISGSGISSGLSGYYGKQQNGGLGSSISSSLTGSGINSGLGPVNGVSGNGVYGSNYQSSSNLLGSYSNGGKPVYESFNNQGPATFGTSGSGSSGLSTNIGSSSSFGQTASGGYNGNTNSFHSTNPDFYKKELNVNSGYSANGLSGGGGGLSQYTGQSQLNQFNSQSQFNNGEKYQGFETARKEQFDCVCVAYEQCPANDVIGRKDDLILPLDPRNVNGKDIDAIVDDNESANKTVVRVTKEAEKSQDTKKIEDGGETKKVSKRDVSEIKSEKKSDDEPTQAEGEARLLGLGALGGGGAGGGHGGKRVIPTFGVSFGLPYPTGNYPLNPYGGINQYGSAISPNGLNLGLVNVNPFVSFQVSKNEYGEKLFSPLVNLHVTPNANILHKVGSFLHAKKEGLFGGGGGGYGGGYGGGPGGFVNQHYHQHTHISEPPEIYHPHHHHTPHYSEPPPSHYPHHSGPAEYYPSHTSPSGYGFYRENTGPSAPTGPTGQYYDPSSTTGSGDYYSRSANVTQPDFSQNYNYQSIYPQNENNQLANANDNYAQNYQRYSANQGADTRQARKNVAFPTSKRRRRDTSTDSTSDLDIESINDNIEERSLNPQKRQSFYNARPQYNNNNFQNQIKQCGPRQVCCRRPVRPVQNYNTCGARNAQGITGRIKNPVYVDGDSEFGEYPWQVAILKKDPKESVYVCGGTLIDQHHIITAAHCIKSYKNFDLRVRLGEWDVNHDVEFYPYIERDVIQIHVHPEYYAGTLDNDIAILRLDRAVDYSQTPHISPACLPDKFSDFSGKRCWTTGWGKDAFGDYGKYQNILKEVDVPIIPDQQCQQQLRQTRLGYNYKLNPGFVCAGGEEGKDACKGDGGGPLVCERNGIWQVVGVVSWGIGCGQVNVPGVYVRVSHYLDWINQITHQF